MEKMQCVRCGSSEVTIWTKKKGLIGYLMSSTQEKYTSSDPTCKGCSQAVDRCFECNKCGVCWCGRCLR
jgi:hypothetical protein